jgi:hypothetical protein
MCRNYSVPCKEPGCDQMSTCQDLEGYCVDHDPYDWLVPDEEDVEVVEFVPGHLMSDDDLIAGVVERYNAPKQMVSSSGTITLSHFEMDALLRAAGLKDA